MGRRFNCLAALGAMAAAGSVQCRPAGAAECTLAAVAVLPLQVERGHFVVPADINGHTANMLLDTGFYATTLNRSSADKLGVRLNATDSETYGIGGTRRQYYGTVKHMRFGQMSADGLEVGGTDIWDADRGPGWDGVLGMNMMARYDIDLDIAGQHAILFEADGSCHRPTVALAPDLYMVPLESIEHDRQADIIITIDGHRFKAMLDTGAAQTALYRDAAMRLGLDLSPLNAPHHAVVGGVGPFPIAYMTHVFQTVQIGNLQVRNMQIGIINQKNSGVDRVHVGSLLADAAQPDEANGEDLLLGADFFLRFHVWISHSSQKVILQYPPLPSVLPH